MPIATWEGASYSMGNSTKQWRASYNPSHKKRMVQEAVHAHTTFTHQLMAQPHSHIPSPLSHGFPLHNSMSDEQGTSRGNQGWGGGQPMLERNIGFDQGVVPMPFQLHPTPREGQVMATFISPKPGRKRKGSYSSGHNMQWGEEWGTW